MMDAFFKGRLMTMNHGVQQEHLGLWKEKKNTKKMCYNFEYKFGEHVPNCALKYGKCDEDCEYMKNFKE